MTKSDHTDTLGKLDVGTTTAWRAAGLSQKQLAARVRAGDLVRIRHGAYATASILAAAKTDPRLSHALHAAPVVSRIHGAVASHHSAALMYGLSLLDPPPGDTVTLTVPLAKQTGRSSRTGVIRHTAELPPGHVAELYGVPVTTAARTVADIARTATFMEGVVVADAALYERHTSKAELRRVLESCQRWPGLGRARQVVEFSSPLAESPLESCSRVIFREQDLPAPELQVNIIGRAGHFVARADFLWRQHHTIAEADGLLKYNGREDAIAQLERDRLLREAGYEVVHFTWKELFTDPAAIAASIRTAFTRAVPSGAPPADTVAP